MARYFDICWRAALVVLVLVAFALPRATWLQVEVDARFTEDPGDKPEVLVLKGPLIAQTGYEVISGGLHAPEADDSRLGGFRDRGIIAYYKPKKVPGSWLMAFYGPSLASLLLAAVLLRPHPRRPLVLLPFVAFAMVLLAGLLVTGFPLVGWTSDLNAAMQADPLRREDGKPVFAEGPTLSVTTPGGPGPSFLVLAVILAVVVFGFWLPKPTPEPTPETVPQPTPEATPQPTPESPATPAITETPQA